MTRIPRPLVLAGLGMAAALLAYLVVRGWAGPGGRATPAPGNAASAPAGPAPNPATATATSGTPAPGHGDPVAVANGFVQANLSWSWNDAPDPNAAEVSRAAAWSTPALVATMSQSSSAAYLTQQRIAAHETDSVTVDNVVEQDPSTATSKTELVLATVAIAKDGAPPSPATSYLELTIVAQPDGSWAVDKVKL